tara:strand:- start:7327 stop:7695 length:369 start_codon:yes stop_codon:yes gene_type:complete
LILILGELTPLRHAKKMFLSIDTHVPTSDHQQRVGLIQGEDRQARLLTKSLDSATADLLLTGHVNQRSKVGDDQITSCQSDLHAVKIEAMQIIGFDIVNEAFWFRHHPLRAILPARFTKIVE